ncbi:MAG: AlbA family DNA-binding domain-containing protein [Acidimicrobiales bacterium]
MNDADIVAMIDELESDRVERKATLSDVDGVCQAICAFANDLPGHREPGVVAIGLDDDEDPTGVPIDDALLLRLAQIRDNGSIYPFPSIVVQRVSVKGMASPS